jgi:hypothetical protein
MPLRYLHKTVFQFVRSTGYFIKSEERYGLHPFDCENYATPSQNL